MAEIWIWNSMASRRRSASDTFEENGIQIIKSYLNKQGHTIKEIDWATADGYNSLSPYILKKLNKFLLQIYFTHKVHILQKSAGFLTFLTQGLLTRVQKNRMRKKLKKLGRDVKECNVRFFGIKVWYGEAFTWAKYLTKQISKYSPETVVIAGGYHATLYEEDILKFSTFDLAIIDEGEYALSALLHYSTKITEEEWSKELFLDTLIKDLAENPIKGLIYRENRNIRKIPRLQCDEEANLNKAFPKYNPDNGKVKVHILLESLGCPWNKCNFCVHNQFTPVYRKRNINELILEIKEMVKQGIGLFRFTGSDTPPVFGGKIGEEIIRNNLHIEFTMGSRAVKNSKNPEIYKEIVNSYTFMIKAGLRGVFIGGETGNDFINNSIMNKGISSDDIIYTIKAIREAEYITGEKVTISLALIYPMPLIVNISLSDVEKDNLLLLQRCNPDSVMISPPGPMKNSAWFNASNEFGFELGDNFIQQFMEYEYVLYKPLTMWPELDIKLQGKTFKQILSESQHFRHKVENESGIPTDLSDEHFLMIRSCGLLNKEGIQNFKKNTMLSIVSSDYSYLDAISQGVTEYSRFLASKNF